MCGCSEKNNENKFCSLKLLKSKIELGRMKPLGHENAPTPRVVKHNFISGGKKYGSKSSD